MGDKQGEKATCWEDVARTSKKIMKNHDHCRRLERTCSPEASGKEIDRLNPFNRRRNKRGFLDKLKKQAKGSLRKAKKRRKKRGKKLKKKKKKKKKSQQIIIKGGVQHFHLGGPV